MWTAVWAQSDNGVIGANGGLPWHAPGDLAMFRCVTEGRALVMGRATFESLPGVLPGRVHCVVTSGHCDVPGVVTVGSLVEAFEAYPGACVIGGSRLMTGAFEAGLVGDVYRTVLDVVVPGDVLAPVWPMSDFDLVSVQPVDATGAFSDALGQRQLIENIRCEHWVRR